MKQSNFKTYSIILVLLCLLMTVITGITPFLNIFEAKAEAFGMVERESERGLDFFKTEPNYAYDSEKESGKNPSIKLKYQSKFLEDVENRAFWNEAIWWIQIFLFVCAGVGLLNLFLMKNSVYKKSVADILKVYVVQYAVVMIYYIISLYFIGLFNQDVLVEMGFVEYSTALHISGIVSTLIFVTGIVIYYLRQKLVVPECITDTKDARVGEFDTIQMISKYKELFDNGVITEEEFNKRKRELMGEEQNEQK